MAKNISWWSNIKLLLLLNTFVLLIFIFFIPPLFDWLIILFLLMIGLEISLLFGLLPWQSWMGIVTRILIPFLVIGYLFYLWVLNF